MSSGNFIFSEIGAWYKFKDIEAPGNFGADDSAVIPVTRPAAAHLHTSGINRPAIVIGNFHRVLGVRPVKNRNSALVPRLYHNIPAGDPDQATVVGQPLLLGGLAGR